MLPVPILLWNFLISTYSHFFSCCWILLQYLLNALIVVVVIYWIPSVFHIGRYNECSWFSTILYVGFSHTLFQCLSPFYYTSWDNLQCVVGTYFFLCSSKLCVASRLCSQQQQQTQQQQGTLCTLSWHLRCNMQIINRIIRCDALTKSRATSCVDVIILFLMATQQ